MKADSLFAAMLGVNLLITPMAFAVETSEIDGGNTITDSQSLNEGDEMTVRQAIMEKLNGGSVVATDVDFYSFYGTAGDEVVITVENGLGGTDGVQIYLALYRPASDGYAMEILDNGTSYVEPVIANDSLGNSGWVLQRTGIYTVGAVSYPRSFSGDAGNVYDPNWGASTQSAGDYDLRVTFMNRVPPEEPTPPEEPAPVEAMPVEIAIKPNNNDKWAHINPKSRGKLPVAILSTPGFNAVTEIDISSLSFGSSGHENSLYKCHKGKDVNGDGRLDLFCHFNNQAANFKRDDVVGTLMGSLKDGTQIKGMAPLKVLAHIRKIK